MRNLWRTMLLAFGVSCAAALGSCSGSLATDPRDLLTSEVSGSWESTEEIGTLGTLQLSLDRVEDSRVYNAVLSSSNGGSLGDAEGYGTLADRHLILDFGTGRPDEYYFEGQVEDDGSSITGIAGQFVFPGQAETLSVEFTYAGPLPAE